MQLTEADAWVRHHVCTGFGGAEVSRLGVAVSGGSDSMALLHFLKTCADERDVPLMAATVDHGLRPEAAEEAAFVRESCKTLGIPHEILRWDGWSGRGNLQAGARTARYRLLADWAGRNRLDSVALGHTMDDQAETFVMRLAREAGVDGLAAMEPVFTRDGARFWRPVLALERAELRAFLTRHGLGWRDDPSNEDEGFDRVKARKAMTVFADIGIDQTTFAAVAHNLASASRGLRRCTRDTAERIARVEAGDVVFERTPLLAAGPEGLRRLLVAALRWVSGADYAPRREAVAGVERALLTATSCTLHGCLVTVTPDEVRIAREFNAVSSITAPLGGLWDGRWRIAGVGHGAEIRALGVAVKDCPDWRETGLPRASLMACPAVWQGERLVAAPLAGLGQGYRVEKEPRAADFFTSVLSH